MAKTLIIYGSLARQRVEKEVSDWSSSVVIEVDAILPKRLKKLGPKVLSGPIFWDVEFSTTMQSQVDQLLVDFLDETVKIEGLETSYEFRKACLGITGRQMLVSHFVNFYQARQVLEEEPIEKIIVSVGSGVSVKAWQQIAEFHNLPIQVLSLDRSRPPFFWQIKRRFQRWQIKRNEKTLRNQKLRINKPLSIADKEGYFLCADPAVEKILGASSENSSWRSAPKWNNPDTKKMELLQQKYIHWSELWWTEWLKTHPIAGRSPEHLILKELCDWYCKNVYPHFATMLIQATECLKLLPPKLVLVGAMHGRSPLMWALAARGLNIKVAAYTLDDAINAQISFEPDLGLCDDISRLELAKEAGMCENKLVMVKSHRRFPSQNEDIVRPKKTIILADTYYCGNLVSSRPILSAWAFAIFVEIAKSMPDYNFLIKPHPLRERPEMRWHYTGFHHLQHWTKELMLRELELPQNIMVLKPEEKLADYLKTDVGLMINIESYAVFEAFASRVPVVSLTPLNSKMLVFEIMDKMGVYQYSSTAEGLSQLVKRNLEDTLYRKQQIDRQLDFLNAYYGESQKTIMQAVETYAMNCGL